MAKKTSMTFDTSTKTWVKSTGSDGITNEDKSDKKDKKDKKKTGKSKTTSKVSDKDAKKTRDIEYCTLEGECTIIPTKSTIKIRRGDTVNLVGVGSYLSGKYFVSKVTRTIDASSGYSQSLTLIKTGFGDSLKKKKSKKKKKKKSTKKIKKSKK